MTTVEKPSEPLQQRRPRPRFLPLVLGTLTALSPLSIDLYLPALPTLQRALHTSASAAQLTVAAYFAGLGLTTLVYGPLADRFGRRLPLLLGVALYVLASLGCAAAPSIEVLIALRFVQAAGGAAGPVIARAVVRDLYRGVEAARLMSLLTLVMGAAPILAPLLGGALLGTFGWRALFVVQALLAVAGLALAAWGLPETAPSPPSPLSLRSLGGHLAGLVADSNLVRYTLVGACSSAGMFAYISGSPFVLIELHGVSAERYGWYFGANAFGLIAASQLNLRLLKVHRPSRVLASALAVTVGAGLWLALHGLTGLGGLLGLTVGLFAFVGSLGLIFPNAVALAMEEQGARAGLASAALGSTQFLIATVASVAVGLFNDGTARPMTVTMALCAVAALAALASGSWRRG